MARRITSIVIAVVLLLTLVPAALAGTTGVSADAGALYQVNTSDGVTITLKRYRPPAGMFRVGGQPVILMPGSFANFNCYDVFTPAGESYDVKLPARLAPWARGDRAVADDPMRYYNMAHYLWTQGYDAWLVNYRGQGRTPFRSGGANGYAIDELTVSDIPAVVGKVFDSTGKHPVWVGHSMGAAMVYGYLQGCRWGSGWNPHVVSDPSLAAMRNNGDGRESIKALISLDGPLYPAGMASPDNLITWLTTSAPMYLNLRPLTRTFGDALTPAVVWIEKVLWSVCGAFGISDLGAANSLKAIRYDDIDPEVARYTVKYALDGGSSRMMAQCSDASAHGKMREDIRNGGWNMYRTVPPDPRAGDGYYYYSENLSKITLPALFIADGTVDISAPGDTQVVYNGKTRTALDEFSIAEGTAHVDLVMGRRAPETMFPKIGQWLSKACAN